MADQRAAELIKAWVVGMPEEDPQTGKPYTIERAGQLSGALGRWMVAKLWDAAARAGSVLASNERALVLRWRPAASGEGPRTLLEFLAERQVAGGVPEGWRFDRFERGELADPRLVRVAKEWVLGCRGQENQVEKPYTAAQVAEQSGALAESTIKKLWRETRPEMAPEAGVAESGVAEPVRRLDQGRMETTWAEPGSG
jgi:hypothetical protein